jgi:hypothetical protein
MAQAARTFRIFVSSTFSDLELERNALQEKVFPALRKLCESRGARFQPIDLRWGVPDEAGLDHRTIQICLEEVDRCRTVSPKPNFIILLGHRYGWRPLPAEIPADEFAAILPLVPGERPADDTEHLLPERPRETLQHWYRLDLNAVAAPWSDRRQRERPGVYVLRPRTDRYVEFAVWEREVEQPLRRVLLAAVRQLDFPPDERLKYEASATEQEIARGALQVEDAPGHVFCFFRAIEGMPKDRRAEGWVDLDPKGQEDVESRDLLEHERTGLKARLARRLPGNIRTCATRWVRPLELSDPPRRGVDPAPIARDHLEALCDDVEAALSNVITAELDRLEEVDPLEKEITDHEAFLRARTRVFLGREATLRALAAYLDAPGGTPLVVHGASGSGKSALMARAVQRARERNSRARVMVRFVGWTPRSTDIRSLLDGICRQVSRAYGADETTIPSDYRELVKEFPNRLALATAEQPLALLLDALDQLSDADQGRRLVWLPVQLPPHVSLVVSTTPGDTLTALERKLPPERRLAVEDMRPDEAEELLRVWLAEVRRTLTATQRDAVLARFARCPYPLYLKLAFEEARRWRAWSPEAEAEVEEGAQALAEDISGLIRQLFARLAHPANHGDILPRRALAYLGAAKNGLSEDEVLDVLSADQVVLDDFIGRARHTPPERRLPVAVWSRLSFDLEPYLTERYADGVNLLTFYHKQLLEVIRDEYLKDREGVERHSLLAKHFKDQPLGGAEGAPPNLRKLSELPYQLTLAEQWDALYETLTDFDFLEAKCTHVAVTEQGSGDQRRTLYGGVYELQEDFRFALERMPAE